MYIKKSQAKQLEAPANAYKMLGFAVSVFGLLIVSYENARPEAVAVALVLALGALAEFFNIMLSRDKALSIIAQRRMQAIQRKRVRRLKETSRQRTSEQN